MCDHDSLQRFIFDQAPVRGEVIHLRSTYRTIVNQHDYPPAIKRLLGEALCVAGLLGAIIKFEGRLTVQFRGNGKLKLLLAQCDSHFNMRGLVKWDGELSYEELMKSFQQGVLVIMLDAGMKSQYQGIVAWRGNSLAESIVGYFKDSEQLPTKIWLTVNDQEAFGMLIQSVPDKAECTVMEQEQGELDWQRISQQVDGKALAKCINDEEQVLLTKLFPHDDLRLFPSVLINFKCTCNRKRGEDAILLLGRKEAEEELNNKQSISVTCDFCNEEYLFDRRDVTEIFKNEHPPIDKFH